VMPLDLAAREQESHFLTFLNTDEE
jgi:hypothetical protein